MDHGTLLTLTVGLPVVAGLTCLVANDRLLRRLVVTVTAVALIASSFLLYGEGGFMYTPAPVFEAIILVLDLVLLAYFLYAGFKFRNPLVMSLTLLQMLPIAYFKFVIRGTEVERVFMVDNLSLLMSLMISIVGSLVVIYALSYMDEHEGHLHLERSRQPRFFFFMLLLLGAMQGLVFSNNIYWLYFFWEVTTLCSYELIRHDGTEIAVKNALTALWMNLLGGVAFMSVLFVGHYVVDSIALDVLMKAEAAPLTLLGFAVLAFAAFTKSAQFPFNKWLQGAMVAPTPVSALLHSSTMVNAGVYLILRIAPAIRGTPLSFGVAMVGAFTFMVTSVLAINERVSKGILAYSTIGNLGLIILCTGINTPLSYVAALTLLIFHSVSKGLLFLGAGVVENRGHSRLIEDWEGLLARLPFTSILMIIGMLSMFLPPFGMLLGKWAAISAISSSPILTAVIIIMMVLVGSTATTIYYAKWLSHLTVLPQVDRKLSSEDLPPPYVFSMVSLVSLSIFLGVGAALVVQDLVLPILPKGYFDPIIFSLMNVDTGIGSFLTYSYWMGAVLIFLVGVWIARMKGGVVKGPYLSGENVPESPVLFKTTADVEVEMTVSGVFLDNEIRQGQLSRYATLAGALVLLAMFLTVVL